MKMEVPWLKLEATSKRYCGSTAQMDRTRKCSMKQVAQAITRLPFKKDKRRRKKRKEQRRRWKLGEGKK